MKVIVCGAGQVGWQIARHLAQGRNEVTVVDNQPDLIERIMETLDVTGIVGNASYAEVLRSAGAADADTIIAATASDEVNMVTCQIAHSVFQVERKIARLRSESYLNLVNANIYRRDHLPIDLVVSPEKEVAIQALRQLTSPATFDTEPFLNGEIEMIGLLLEEDCPVLNKPLKQLSEVFSRLRATVVGIRRDDNLFVPSPMDSLMAGDQAYIIVHAADKARCLDIFGKKSKEQSRVLIIGGGNVGLNVARALEQSSARIHCKIIEANRECAENAADGLERTIVLHGDGMDIGILNEANIDNCDAVLAVTDDDKTNLLVGARAKIMNCPLAVCLVNDPSLVNLMEPLGIDAIINPRATTVSSILRHIRSTNVQAIYSIGDAEAEVIEAKILSSSPIAGKAIRDIDWPDGVLVGLIKQGDVIMRPSGDTKVQEGDVVVIFALSKGAEKVGQMVQVGIDFF